MRPEKTTKRAIFAPFALLVLIAGMTAACEEKNTYVPPPPPKVTVTKPVQKPVTDYLEFTGNIAAVQTVELRARVEGYLKQVLFQDGDLVKKGQLLFQIEQAPYIAQVDAAKADLARAQAAFKQAKLTAERRRTAGRSGAISKQQVDEAEAIQEGQAAEVLAKKAALETAELNLGYTKVYSPFDGRIGRRLVDPGNLVGAGEQTLLAEVNQIEPVYVYFTINERTLLPIMQKRRNPDPGTEGQRKTQPLFLGLATDEDYPYEGYMDFAAITLDPNTGTLQLRGVFKNPDRKLLPGLFAKIRAPVSKDENAMLVPQQAVGFDQQGEYVMVVDADDTVERRGVEQGPISDGMRVITKGLKGDEQVIVKGLLRAIPGRKVTPETEHTSASAATPPSQPASSPQTGKPDTTEGSSAPAQSQ
jgi:RND family efflux transporter MFP subunit